jgi:hypothetical protein
LQGGRAGTGVEDHQLLLRTSPFHGGPVRRGGGVPRGGDRARPFKRRPVFLARNGSRGAA